MSVHNEKRKKRGNILPRHWRSKTANWPKSPETNYIYTVKPLYTEIRYNDTLCYKRQFEWNDTTAQDEADN